MSAFNVDVSAGKTVRLPTAGKYCDRDIVITATADDGSYGDGYANGVHDEYARFWDGYQDEGNRTNYSKAFCGQGWTDKTFSPMYNLKPNNCDEMFRSTAIVNVVGILERNGIILDTSHAELFSHMFANTKIEEAPHVDLTAALNASYLFNNCQVLKKASLTFALGMLNSYKYMFSGCSGLEDLEISGVIDVELSFANSPNLTTESVQSIIDALRDLSASTYTKKVTFHANVLNRLTNDQINAIWSKNWTI